MKDQNVYFMNIIRYKRLMRRANYVSICGLVCSLASIPTHMIDFVFAGLAFQIAAVFYAIAAGNARKAALREVKRREYAVSLLKPK